MSKKKKFLEQLQPRDFACLKSLYDLRCLTLEQIYTLHYRINPISGEINSIDSARKKTKSFLDNQLIEKIEIPNRDPCYFLMKKGVDVLRDYFGLPAEVYDKAKKVMKRGYFRASELKIQVRGINHQLHLNQFYIDFFVATEDMNVDWSYLDSKHIEAEFYEIVPDGILELDDVLYFIETDMGTETRSQINEKWENYRRFLNSSNYHALEKPIVVLFVIENVVDTKKRIDMVKYSGFENLLNLFGEKFDVAVNTRPNIIRGLLKARRQGGQARSLLHAHSFLTASGKKMKDYFRQSFALFIKHQESALELVVDDYSLRTLGVLKKISYLDYFRAQIMREYKKDLGYLVIVPDEQAIYEDMDLVELLGISGVYFTTLDRLNAETSSKAFFSIDIVGNCYRQVNYYFDTRLFEKKF